ncbi:phosphoenolpyruvate synthase [bacterium (Candidatus Howlettbacteria) CG_4_10_14_3_um_filter_37_10]|nr:MAG: phosphoenolpyruvate synthase [bacterium (Candidatus Howlettbacteria) CG_4_10_14_3_um_filter_37_10]
MADGDKHILWFSEVGKGDGATVGGKGANLGELLKAGIPVPNGYNITAQAYFYFLEKAGLKEQITEILDGLDVENSKDLQERAERVQALIEKATMPEDLKAAIVENYHRLKGDRDKLYVAVRSSATAEDLADASFAGQQSTYLNVIGEEGVLEAVQKCYASLFGARAIYYREDKGFGQLEVGIAVPVQEMVDAEKAGVMFTIDPTNNDLDHISIEAAYGLGEVVVLGAVTPDRYLVDKNTMQISAKEIHKQTWMLTRESGSSDTDDPASLQKAAQPVAVDLQDKQKLTDDEILELAEIGKKIEAHYGKPQDTEFTVYKGKVYMVQSRPVTTLGDALEKREEEDAAAAGTPVIASVDPVPAAAPVSAAPQAVATTTEKEVVLKGSSASAGLGGGPVKIIHSPSEIDKILEGDVLVTEMTTPDYVPAMKRASGIVTDAGGRTCHAAIVSRELGIPCVVGTETATETLKSYDAVTVDGSKGLVYKGLLAEAAPQPAAAPGVPGQAAGPVQVMEMVNEPITATRVYLNLGEPELAEEMAKRNVDGVGLMRAEFIIMEYIKEHPLKAYKEGRAEEWTDKLAEGLEKMASAFYPRPVVYRATDFKTNEYRNLPGGEDEPHEENPMIGYRGCFRYMKEPELFNMELEAIKKVRKNNPNLHLMIPFVRRVDEFMAVKKLVEDSGLKRGPDFKLWIMVEVPSTVFLIDKFIECGIDGISIGSNDLTQLILGLDRDSSIVAEEYDERNEAVQIALKRIIEVCREKGVTASICGQAPSVYPEITEKLVEYGVTSVSVSPDVIDSTRRLIASVEEKLLLRELAEVRKNFHI